MVSNTAVGGEQAKVPVIGVLGAGPKAMALAAKARVLEELGLGSIKVVVIEESSVGANWSGSSGYTNGYQELGTSPEKDVAFPYRSSFGKMVDAASLAYSWSSFLVDKDEYSNWIDRGRPQPRHREFAEYLRWVNEKAKPTLMIGRLTRIKPLSRHCLGLTISSHGENQQVDVDGLVITGPGRALPITGRQDDDAEAILNGRNYWQRRAIFKEMNHGRVAVIGAGETAASIVLSLIDIAPELKIDLINRHGTLYTRGESFTENRLFSLPDEWANVDEFDREEFIKRTDRGVFSVAAQTIINTAENVHLVTGTVREIHAIGGKVVLRLQRGDLYRELEYDRVVVAIGFDPFSPLDLLPAHMRPADQRKELRHGIDRHLRIPVKAFPDSPTTPDVNIHMPMLAGFAQGPGFPNLSCLGALADRVLSLYVETSEGSVPSRT